MATIQGFHHTAIRSSDFDASVRFYTEILGLTVRTSWGESNDRACMIDAGSGDYIEIFERGAFESAENVILHYALRTDDCVAMTETVRAAGLPITLEPTSLHLATPEGKIPVTISFFKGPDGEVVELFQNDVL